jgi:hypothetical protein
MSQRVIVESFLITGATPNYEPTPGGALNQALQAGWRIVSTATVLVISPKADQFIYGTFVLEKHNPTQLGQAF